ncbi:MAG: hypothetical protein WBD67_09470 [Terracidiphilus sp.]
MYLRPRLLLSVVAMLVALPLFNVKAQAAPPDHDHFRVAVYIPVGVVEKMKDPAYLEHSWQQLSSQVKVDKVYIESYRSGQVADGALLETVKKFFVAHGVQVAGGIAYVGNGDHAGGSGSAKNAAPADPGQFVSMCYTDPAERALVKRVAELTARHFNEIILDDFFFYNTKDPSDIAAKGAESWTNFRLRMMDEASRNLVEGAARSVNPHVKVIIKFPNWYEHFQANGYDLGEEPKIFDGIYTGTETRDPVFNDQHLQQYESFEIMRYFDHVAPGHNGGGWVDTYGTMYVDRYAEQLWDTMLAKAPQILLFQYSDLLNAPRMGDRKAWSALETSFTAAGLDHYHAATGAETPINYATVAGYSLASVNAIAGRLGSPVGIASYKPYQSTGEDFLQNYLGMIGIPIEMYPAFPTEAHTILLTREARFDPKLVSEIKTHVEQGGTVIVTTGLLKAIQGSGTNQFGQLAEMSVTGNVLEADSYQGFFAFGGGPLPHKILVPEVEFMTNDAWPMVRLAANGSGAPLLFQDHYGKGLLYVLTIPENPADLYALPEPVLNGLRRYLLRGLPVQFDAPSQVSLFPYDNHAFVAESFRDEPATVTVTLAGTGRKLRNLATGALVTGEAPPPMRTPFGTFRVREPETVFTIALPPHSFAGFAWE